MLPQSGRKAAEIVAFQPVALGGGVDDRTQPRIMGVRHVREQVMLNLMVQAAGEPGRQS